MNRRSSDLYQGDFESCRSCAFKRTALQFAEKLGKADPEPTKVVRDDKYKGVATAQLKLRPFKIALGRVFQQLFSR